MALVDRVRNIVVNPEREWPVIAQERTDAAQIVTGYVVPLALVSALAGFVGSMLLAAVLPFGGLFGGFLGGLIGACISVLVVVIACYLVALIINVLAPYFGARADYNQAFKTAAYGNTPALAAGVLQIIPARQPGRAAGLALRVVRDLSWAAEHDAGAAGEDTRLLPGHPGDVHRSGRHRDHRVCSPRLRHGDAQLDPGYT